MQVLDNFWITLTVLTVVNTIACFLLCGIGQLCWLLERWLHPSINPFTQYFIIGAILVIGLLLLNTWLLLLNTWLIEYWNKGK